MWLLKRWVEAYENPRGSARRLLDIAPSAAQAVAMAVAGFALHVAMARLASLALGSSAAEVLLSMTEQDPDRIATQLEAARSFGGLIETFLLNMVSFVGVATLAWGIGQRFGGSGSFSALLTMSGWHALAAAPAGVAAEILLVLSSPGLFGLGFLVQIAATLYLFYMMSAFIAEAHGFPSAGQVMAVSLGVMFVIGVLFVSLSVMIAPLSASAAALG